MKWMRMRAFRLAMMVPFLAIAITVIEKTITIIGPLLPYIASPKSADGVNPALLGMWYEEFQFPDRGGHVHFEGTIEFFANKSCRITGLLKCSVTLPISGLAHVSSYNFDGNGEWQATDEELVIKLLNVKAPLSGVTLAGIAISPSETKYPPSSDKTDVEQGLLLAQSQRYDIRRVEKNELVLETNGLYADTFTISMKRTKKMYMR